MTKEYLIAKHFIKHFIRYFSNQLISCLCFHLIIWQKKVLVLFRHSDMFLFQNLRQLRHPYVLSYWGSTADIIEAMLLTERVQMLDLAIDALSPIEIHTGLTHILEALVFLHDKVSFSRFWWQSEAKEIYTSTANIVLFSKEVLCLPPLYIYTVTRYCMTCFHEYYENKYWSQLNDL